MDFMFAITFTDDKYFLYFWWERKKLSIYYDISENSYYTGCLINDILIELVPILASAVKIIWLTCWFNVWRMIHYIFIISRSFSIPASNMQEHSVQLLSYAFIPINNILKNCLFKASGL